MKDYFYEADITSIGGSIVLKDRIGAHIRYEVYCADMIYEDVQIPVFYKKYRKGRGKIEYSKNGKYRESIDRIYKRLEFDFENNINGMQDILKRRLLYSIMGLVLYVFSMILGTIYGFRVLQGAAYIPSMAMMVICGLICVYIFNLTDRVVRD